MADVRADAEALIPKFKFERRLNQDQAGRRVSLLGSIDAQPALLVVERAPFPDSGAHLGGIATSLSRLRNLGANDVYHWFMARSAGGSSQAGGGGGDGDDDDDDDEFAADMKMNLIYPCTATHIKKYTAQPVRYVLETPEVYASRVRPYMVALREQGRLNWVFNIIEGRKEVEDVIYRTALGASANEQGFLLLPDLNWDRKTTEAMHLLAIVERRDIWSLRDLRKTHLPWLRAMRRKLVDATTETYGAVEADQVKLYVHYQPTYYHFHIHIVHVALEAGATQATGKAVGLDWIIETLEVMGGGGEAGMERLSIGYTVGEESDLWKQVYEPMKSGRGSASR